MISLHFICPQRSVSFGKTKLNIVFTMFLQARDRFSFIMLRPKQPQTTRFGSRKDLRAGNIVNIRVVNALCWLYLSAKQQLICKMRRFRGAFSQFHWWDSSEFFEACLLEAGFRAAWSIVHLAQKIILRSKNVCIVRFIWITEHRYGRRQAESSTKLINKVNHTFNSNTSKSMYVRAFLVFWNLCLWKT